MIGAVGQFIQYVSGYAYPAVKQTASVSWKPALQQQRDNNFKHTGKKERKASKRRRHQAPPPVSSDWSSRTFDPAFFLDRSGSRHQDGLARQKAIENGRKLPPLPEIKSLRDFFIRGLELTPSQPTTYAGLPPPVIERIAGADAMKPQLTNVSHVASRYRRQIADQSQHTTPNASLRPTMSSISDAMSSYATSSTAPTQVTMQATTPSVVSPSEAPLLAEVSAAPLLAPNWVDAIDWLAFDDVAFFSLCGVRNMHHAAGLPGRLRAMHDCFMPRLAEDRLPLDITQFDSSRVALFVNRIMAQITPYHVSNGASDPAFSQDLFTRWFVQFAALRSGHGDDVRYEFPLNQALLKLAHPDAPHRRPCDDNAPLAPLLPRIGTLKNELRQQYLKSYAYLNSEAAMRWAFEGLCQLFEPTLVRQDLPAAFRYGSLAWALLSIGIDLSGDAHVNMTSHELVSLAMASDVLSARPTDGSDGADDADVAYRQTIRRNAMHTILRMAHAQGKIDLRGGVEMQQADLEVALNLFQSQLFSEKAAPLEALIAGLPMRRDTANAMLREHGFIRPEQRFTFSPHRTYSGGLEIAYPKIACRLSAGSEYTLSEAFMMDCLDALKASTSLMPAEQNLLQVSKLKHSQLTARFEKEFDAGMKRLTHQIMLPALQDQLEFMDDEDEKFWRCGQWEVRIPSATINTERRSLRSSGASETARYSHTPIAHEAKDSVLIRLTLALGQPARTYWMTLEPFELRRYESSDRALLDGSISRFFKPLKADDKLIDLNRHRDLTYTDYTASNSDGSLLQTISEQILRNRVTDLRETARETTAPEAFKANVREMLLNFIPLRACVKALQADQRDDATLYCTLDVLGLVPPAVASVKLGKAIFAVGAGMNKAQIKDMVRVFMLGNVNRGDAMAIVKVLHVGKPAMNFATHGVRLLDPGFEMMHGMLALPFRFGAVALRQLIKKIGGITELKSVATQLKHAEQLALKFYPEGHFWRAAPNAVTVSHGQRSVVLGDKTYAVLTIGPTTNVAVINHGDVFSLVNPSSGLGYGPSLRRSSRPGQLELASLANTRRDAARQRAAWLHDVRLRYAGVCRVKRAGGMLPAVGCQLRMDHRFGPHGYTIGTPALRQHYQFRLTDAPLGYSNFDSTLTRGVSDALKRIRVVNTADRGYATSFRTAASGKSVPLVPNSEARFVSSATANDSGGTLSLPHEIAGRIVHRSQTNSQTGADFVAFSLYHTEAYGSADVTLEHTRYVPFGTYQERSGLIVGLAYLDGSVAYRFDVNPSSIPLVDSERGIRLTLASNDEIRKFERFQSLLLLDQTIANPLVAHAAKLRDVSPALQARFNQVFERSQTILGDALSAMNTENLQPLIADICAKFLAMEPRSQRLYTFLNKHWERLKTMQASMPYLKQQSPDVVGFFSQAPANGGARTVANTLSNSMADEISFRHINKPLITFDASHFMDSTEVLDTDVANLLHEYSHALLNTKDAMHPAASMPTYGTFNNGEVGLGRISEAAALPGSEPENHAPIFEHLTMLMAYLNNEGTKHLALQYLAGKDGYTRAVRLDDFERLLNEIQMWRR